MQEVVPTQKKKEKTVSFQELLKRSNYSPTQKLIDISKNELGMYSEAHELKATMMLAEREYPQLKAIDGNLNTGNIFKLNIIYSAKAGGSISNNVIDVNPSLDSQFGYEGNEECPL